MLPKHNWAASWLAQDLWQHNDLAADPFKHNLEHANMAATMCENFLSRNC